MGGRREVAGVSREPVRKARGEKTDTPQVARATADRVGEPGDGAGIGTRQTGDNGIDQRDRAIRFRRQARERLANRSVRASCRGSDLVLATSFRGGPKLARRFDNSSS